MRRISTWRNPKFLVFGVLAVALAVGYWSWQRQKAAEQKQETEVQTRRATLERAGRQQRAWRTARAVLDAADRVLPALTDSEVWRAAQMDVARDLKVPMQEMLRDLEIAFPESRSTAEEASSSLNWLIAGDIGFALYRLTEARTCYESANRAQDARNSSVTRQVEERAAKLLHELGGCAQECRYWKFAAAVGDSGDGPGNAVEAAIRLGRCSQALRQEADSLNALHMALASTERSAGPNSRDVIVPLARLLSALTVFGKFPEAESAARRLVELSEVQYGADGYGTGMSLLLECELFIAQKRWPELIAVSQRTGKILDTTVGEIHPASMEAQSAMAVALLESDRAAESETVYRGLLDKAEKYLPRDHIVVGLVTGQLAHTVAARDRKAEAEGLYRGAIDIIEHSPERLRPMVADYQASLGQMLASLHRTEEAEALLRQALTLVSKADDRPRQAKVCVWLAELLRNAGRVAEADEMMDRSAKALANQPAPSTVEDRISLLMGRSDSLKAAGRFVEAEAAIRDALAVGEASLPGDSVTLAMALNNLGLLLVESGRGTEGEKYLRRSLDIHLKVQGPNHNMVADTLVNLAGIAHSRGQVDEALQVTRRALAIYEVSYGKEHPRVAITLSNLAYFLQGLGRYDEAENAQRRSVQVTEKCFGPESAETGTRLRFLAVILQAAGREKEASQIMDRVRSITDKDQRGTGGAK